MNKMEDFSDYMKSTPVEDFTLAFRAIKDLIGDLKELYPKSTPLALYNRIIQHIKESDSGSGMSKCIDGFKDFFVAYATYLDSVDLMMQKVTRGTIIKYGTSDKIYIDIQKFLYLADEETREAIRLHLLTIATILEPDESSLKKLDSSVTSVKSDDILCSLGFEKGSNEYNFIDSIYNDIKSSLEGVDATDPTQAVMGLLPTLPAMMSKLKEKVLVGNIDIQKIIQAAGNMQTQQGMPDFNTLSAMFAHQAAGDVVNKDVNEVTEYDNVD
jgi:hypothetical protein